MASEGMGHFKLYVVSKAYLSTAYRLRTIKNMREDIGLAKLYTTSKAYHQTAFGLRTLHFCLQHNVPIERPACCRKLVIAQACFEPVLTRNI